MNRENFSESYIRKLQADSKRDPVLIERTIFAFGLLDALCEVGLPFVFKGGTSLMLLLKRPHFDGTRNRLAWKNWNVGLSVSSQRT